METRGSQTREMLSDTNLSISGWADSMTTLLLFNESSRKYEVWQRNDDYAGYVVVAYESGYEFCHEASDAECRIMGLNAGIRLGSALVDIGKGKTYQECEDAIAEVMRHAKG